MKCLRFAPKSGLSTVSVAAMKVDSSASYFLRQIPLLALAAAALGGCSAAGESTGEHTISASGGPITFRVPVEFTKESVDEFDTRGEVVLAAGVDKLDVVALRQVAPGIPLPRGDLRHRVQGRSVTSRLHAIPGGWALECQWTAERRTKVLDACGRAVGSIQRR